MFSDNVLSDVDKEIKLGFDGFDATQYLDDRAAMTYQDFREQFLSYNYCTKEKLQKDVSGYDDDEDEEDNIDEEDGGKQQKVLVQEKNKEGGEQRDENKHIKGLHKENVDNIVIVLSDEEEEEEEEEEVKEQIDDHDLHRHGDDDEVVEESEEIGEESEEEEEDEEFTFDGESDFCLSLGKKRKNTRGRRSYLQWK
ncbi:hypothetical protein ACLB2K_015438 [Fragaria x ananassa]